MQKLCRWMGEIPWTKPPERHYFKHNNLHNSMFISTFPCPARHCFELDEFLPVSHALPMAPPASRVSHRHRSAEWCLGSSAGASRFGSSRWARPTAPGSRDLRRSVGTEKLEVSKIFQSHGGTPSHPFLDGIFGFSLNHPAMGYIGLPPFQESSKSTDRKRELSWTKIPTLRTKINTPVKTSSGYHRNKYQSTCLSILSYQ